METLNRRVEELFKRQLIDWPSTGERYAALADVKTLVAKLSLEITEKVLRKELSDKKAQESLVNDYVKDLNLN